MPVLDVDGFEVDATERLIGQAILTARQIEI